MSKGKNPINFPTDTYKSFYLVGQFGLQAGQQVVPPKYFFFKPNIDGCWHARNRPI